MQAMALFAGGTALAGTGIGAGIYVAGATSGLATIGVVRLGTLGRLLYAFEQEIAASGATTMVGRIFALQTALHRVHLESIKVEQLPDGGYGIFGKTEIVRIAIDGTVTVIQRFTGEILKVIK
jgi:hypothetical protein